MEVNILSLSGSIFQFGLQMNPALTLNLTRSDPPIMGWQPAYIICFWISHLFRLWQWFWSWTSRYGCPHFQTRPGPIPLHCCWKSIHSSLLMHVGQFSIRAWSSGRPAYSTEHPRERPRLRAGVGAWPFLYSTVNTTFHDRLWGVDQPSFDRPGAVASNDFAPSEAPLSDRQDFYLFEIR